MTTVPGSERLSLSEVDPVVAVCLPIVVAPFGSLLGGLFVSHLLRSEIDAVWVTTAVLTSLSFLVVSLRS
ncbi:hypothetical protein [Halorarum halobium]|uniref:hypothetical protein n=1 Tax=Halorarum halobium TaxID=3075121 RepID=UPI0028ACC3F7|nr:hypothetical protein [Halobaculum sp. XH14]